MKSIGPLFTVYFDLSVANLYYTSTHLPAVGRSPPSLNKETRRIPIENASCTPLPHPDYLSLEEEAVTFISFHSLVHLHGGELYACARSQNDHHLQQR